MVLWSCAVFPLIRQPPHPLIRSPADSAAVYIYPLTGDEQGGAEFARAWSRGARKRGDSSQLALSQKGPAYLL